MQQNQFFRLIMSMLLIVMFISCEVSEQINYSELIANGDFSQAKEIIKEKLIMDTTLTAETQRQLEFEIERMDRIKKDFRASENEVFDYIQKYIPDVKNSDLQKWENEKSLESKMIDGEKKYFNRAARNLFRINKDCKKLWEEFHKQKEIDLSKDKIDIDVNNNALMKNSIKKGKRYSEPVTMKINYTISVNPNVVPEGEMIRCWIPFPREIENRQFNIKLLKSEPEKYQLADNMVLQRTIYFEKLAVKDKEAKFTVEYQYTSQGEYVYIETDKVTPVDVNGELKEFLKEESPHIVFTERLKNLSGEIVGDEANPYYKAQKIYQWIDENIPWASAREYSTFRNISDYCINNGHGDCGIKGLTFITLLRLNGIPARWQSGWEFQPPHDSMHDWGYVYFDPYGWMPMDVEYGMRKTDDERLKWFYLSGMDSYRLIFNDEYSKPFVPAKIHHRSETIDSQRGEVEWKGGNLYFDQWDWDMKFEEISE
jgi:transglutaminase superfamily protein